MLKRRNLMELDGAFLGSAVIGAIMSAAIFYYMVGITIYSFVVFTAILTLGVILYCYAEPDRAVIDKFLAKKTPPNNNQGQPPTP